MLFSDSDYNSTSSTLSFAPGQTNATITVVVNGDTKFEPDETFVVNLSSAVNATISDSQGQGTILNDDIQPAISINDVTVVEGNSGTVDATFTVTLSHLSYQTITLNYATANGTAVAPGDYTAISTTTLTFNPDEPAKTITVVVKGDTLNEVNETFFVNLSSPVNAIIADSQGKGNNWQDIAAANGIENPRMLQPGQLLDMNVSAGSGIQGASSAIAGITGRF